jgi:excinuclease ABC subunit C
MNPESPALEAQPRLPAAVEETLAHLPAEPGCYIFKDAEGTVLYVGKARSLRDRVRSYFRNPGGLSLKNRGLVPRIASIDYQILPSENAALLVEYNLIKQYRPKYNIVMRDDKSFLSIRITNEPYPRIEAVRRRADDGARYFGPYTSSQSVYRTLDLVKRLFPYRSCRLNIVPPRDGSAHGPGQAPIPVPALRRPTRREQRRAASLDRPPPQDRTLTVADPANRPCLEYHIHRCAAPCIDAISQADYAAIIDQAALLLQGRSEQVTAQLRKQMEEAAEALDFERAARLRDQLEAVRKVTERQRVTVVDGHDQDVIGMARAEDEACVELIAVREGRMLGHKQFVLQGTADQDDGVVLAAFLKQYYIIATEVPEEVLVPVEPDDAEAIGALLNGQRGRKVALLAPRRGDKVELVKVAQENAREAADQRRQRWLNDTQKGTQAISELQKALDLPRLPVRIECFDISNLQGTSTVGSMVVFENGRPKTSAYRRFRIKTVVGSDDFASMAEMVRRRLKRAEASEHRTPMVPLDAAEDAPSSREYDDGVTGDHPTGSAGSVPASFGLAEPGHQEVSEDGAAEAVPLPGVEEEEATPAPDEDEALPTADEAGAPEEQAAPSTGWERPDLMIIDGGKGQLNAVLAVFAELGITDQPVVSLAKQHEELFLPGHADSILLPSNSQALFLVQRIRDEAHRFAITYHRDVRGKRSLESQLDSVPGVGARRKRDLLRHFGSLSALRKADVEDIAALQGIGPKTARAIKDYLGEG